jgi:hypothetical protein
LKETGLSRSGQHTEGNGKEEFVVLKPEVSLEQELKKMSPVAQIHPLLVKEPKQLLQNLLFLRNGLRCRFNPDPKRLMTVLIKRVQKRPQCLKSAPFGTQRAITLPPEVAGELRRQPGGPESPRPTS